MNKLQIHYLVAGKQNSQVLDFKKCIKYLIQTHAHKCMQAQTPPLGYTHTLFPTQHPTFPSSGNGYLASAREGPGLSYSWRLYFRLTLSPRGRAFDPDPTILLASGIGSLQPTRKIRDNPGHFVWMTWERPSLFPIVLDAKRM